MGLLKEKVVIDSNNEVLESDEYIYDGSDRMIKKITEYEPYDEKKTSPFRYRCITEYEYNDKGLLIKTTDSNEKIKPDDMTPLNKNIQYDYDNNGNLISIIEKYDGNEIPDSITGYIYDNRNNIIQKLVNAQVVKVYVYDYTHNRLDIKIDIDNMISEKYFYDENGSIERIVSKKTRKFKYNKNNKISSIVIKDRVRKTYQYDKDGDLTTVMKFNKHGELKETIEYTYY